MSVLGRKFAECFCRICLSRSRQRGEHWPTWNAQPQNYWLLRIKQAQSSALSSTRAQLSADVRTTKRNGMHTSLYDAVCSWAPATCFETGVSQKFNGGRTRLAGFIEEPAFQIRFRVEKVLWQLLILDINQRKCVTLAAETRIISMRVYKAGRLAKGVCQGLGQR